MKGSQRIIKYFAIAFGIGLSVLIIYSISMAILVTAEYGNGIINFFEPLFSSQSEKHYDDESTLKNISEEFDDITSIEVISNCSKLKIVKSDKFAVEAKNVTDDFSLELNNNKDLKINDKIFNKKTSTLKGKTPEITIYVTDKTLENLTIKTGIANANISDVTSNLLSLEGGTGNVEIKNIKVNEQTYITAGVGNLDIVSSTLNNLNLNLGVGNANIEASILKNSKIDCGVGNLDMTLNGNKEEYKIKAETGLGKMEIDGKRISKENFTYLNGENEIQIDGGMGNINVYFN